MCKMQFHRAHDHLRFVSNATFATIKHLEELKRGPAVFRLLEFFFQASCDEAAVPRAKTAGVGAESDAPGISQHGQGCRRRWVVIGMLPAMIRRMPRFHGDKCAMTSCRDFVVRDQFTLDNCAIFF